MMFRVYLANALLSTVAEIGQKLEISGSAMDSIGFGDWGIEPTVIIELGGASREQVQDFVTALFEAYPKEQAVYVTEDGMNGQKWFKDGRVE